MLPLRATLPTTPEPGWTMLKSSSITTESGMAVTVGPPFMAVLPLPTTTMPLLPDSEAPMASVRIRSGKTSKNWSFTDGEKTAALLDSEKQRGDVEAVPVGLRGSRSGAGPWRRR